MSRRVTEQEIELNSKSKSLIITSDSAIAARKAADVYTQSDLFYSIADFPMLIDALIRSPAVRSALRPCHFVDTLTSEYHGRRGNKLVYEVWHSIGSLAYTRGFSEAFPKRKADGFSQVNKDEWEEMGRGNFLGRDVPRFHVRDLIKLGWRDLAPGTPHTIFAYIEDMNVNPFFDGCALSHGELTSNHRAVMLSSSYDRVDQLAQLLFENETDPKARVSFFPGSKQQASFSSPKGRLISLGSAFSGIRSSYNRGSTKGRFLVLPPNYLSN